MSPDELSSLVREAIYAKPPSMLSALRRKKVEPGEYLAYARFGMANIMKHDTRDPEELWSCFSPGHNDVELSCADFSGGTFVYLYNDHSELHMKKRGDTLILSLDYKPLRPGRCYKREVQEVLAPRLPALIDMAMALDF